MACYATLKLIHGKNITKMYPNIALNKIPTIFKFREINKRMIESLVSGEVYFAPPGQLNDPFDCQIDLRKSIDTAIEKVNTNEKKLRLIGLKENVENLFIDLPKSIENFGVWSGSLNLENPLMWAHYADEHRGICLTYDLPKNFIDYKLGDVIGIHPVEYNSNPMIDFFLAQVEAETFDTFDDFLTKIIVKLLTSKDECWEYEKEGRVISNNSGLKKIGKSALRQVCFGLRTTESDKELVREILDKHGYDVNICEIERDDNDFGLRTKEV